MRRSSGNLCRNGSGTGSKSSTEAQTGETLEVKHPQSSADDVAERRENIARIFILLNPGEWMNQRRIESFGQLKRR